MKNGENLESNIDRHILSLYIRSWDSSVDIVIDCDQGSWGLIHSRGKRFG
jgi:hypothetical protein